MSGFRSSDPLTSGLFRGLALLSVIGGCWLMLAGCDKAPEVETLRPRVGEIRESFVEPAKTRLAKTYPISMPVSGRVGRIELEPGDRVAQGAELAAFDRLPLEQLHAEARAAVAELEARLKVQDDDRLEETAKIEVQASISAAGESLKASKAEVDSQRARSVRADKELDRIKKLEAAKTVTQRELDDAQLLAETSLIDLRRQEFYYTAFNFIYTAIKLGPRYIEDWLGRKRLNREAYVQQLVQARARLARAEHDLQLATVASPIDGVVLERYEQGDQTLAAGHPLLLLGNLDELEVLADVLTQDALRLQEGSLVRLEPAVRWPAISGRVKRIEPRGFTKLSSLGVEQQRVNVIVALDERPAGLGVGYRLQARFITGGKQEALIVPRFSVMQEPYAAAEDGATTQTDGAYYVMKVVGGALVKQGVKLGLRSDLHLEILEGLSDSDTIVATPDGKMTEGLKVKEKE